MWTIKARELMLEAMHEASINGATLILFEGAREIARIDIPEPATRLENGSLIFNETETIALDRGRPDNATISVSELVLLELNIPDELLIEPADIVPGALIQIKEILIQ